nr:MAG TPA: hypothetical protein [Caudoviricetes sp.]DAR53388.1 MAG TPA: hypothetical protein [Caudoviricetes sp.]DAZ28647.1 MAG TPA: hypothetical protein [Caudoviricetes sp.]
MNSRLKILSQIHVGFIASGIMQHRLGMEIILDLLVVIFVIIFYLMMIQGHCICSN